MGVSSTRCPEAQLSSGPMLSAWRRHHLPQLGAQRLWTGPLCPPPRVLAPVSGPQHHLCPPRPLAGDNRSLRPPARLPCFAGAGHGRQEFLKKITKDVKGCESVARGGDTWGEHAKDHLMVGAGAGAATRACVLVPQPALLRPLLWGFPAGFLPWV